MRLSMEIPIPHLEYFSAVCDMDFALAHMVLEDKTYAEFYREQSARGRQVIMDNSFHELGYPLSAIQLREAAKKIKPMLIVSPDYFGKAKETYDAFKACFNDLGRDYQLAFVLQGADMHERHQLFSAVRNNIACLMFPFREPKRLMWFQELWSLYPDPRRWPPFIHLLGVSTLRELSDWRSAFEIRRFSSTQTSYDTAKPLKWGINYKRFSDPDQSLRGGGRINLHLTMNATQIESAMYNIAVMRRYA